MNKKYRARIIQSLVCCLCYPISAAAISQINYDLDFEGKVVPMLRRELKGSHFPTSNGISLHLGKIQLPKSLGTVLVVPGRTESIGSFFELIYDIRQAGFSVVIFDHRGQGRSTRLVRGSDVGHVEEFSDYVVDLESIVNSQLIDKMPKPYFLLATSMGAAISTLYLSHHPGIFSAAAMTAPMYQIKTQPIPEPVAMVLARILGTIGMWDKYIPFSGSFNSEMKFSENNFTHSQARFDRDMRRLALDHETVVGSPSVKWIYESIKATRQIPTITGKISTPILIFQAGKDEYVVNEAHNNFCSRANDCRIIQIPRAYHCLLIEEDTIRSQVLSESFNFFKQRKLARVK